MNALRWVLLKLPERSSMMFTNLAGQHPAEAVERLATADQLEVISLARGILRTAPEQASEALRRIEDPGERAELFLAAAQVTTLLRDFFPEPGRRSSLRDYPQRYEALSAALASSGFSPADETRMREALHTNFLGHHEE